MLMPRRLLAALAVWLLAGGTALAAAEEDDPWPDLREALFEQRPIVEDGSVIALDAPYRAYDAAIVPVTLQALLPQTPERYIKSLTLVIDKNPAPVAAVFHLGPRSGDATIATRVRVNEYTTMRVIAELNDGSLHMASRFVKAAGGCSAPALKDQEAALARLGRMKLKQARLDGAAEPGKPRQAQLLISHPNYSGLQMNQLTRHYIPAEFVQDIRVSSGGQTILTVEGAISLSEDPSIRFSFLPQDAQDISVWARDTEGRVFEGRWPLDEPAGS